MDKHRGEVSVIKISSIRAFKGSISMISYMKQVCLFERGQLEKNKPAVSHTINNNKHAQNKPKTASRDQEEPGAVRGPENSSDQ